MAWVRAWGDASAYRAYLLTAAARRFGRDDWQQAAEANLAFVLGSQGQDGSWLYALDGRDAFIDNFHTCFVLKNLAKIQRITRRSDLISAIRLGYAFYRARLLDEDSVPLPFARTQRFTLPYRELYDYAEGINLGLLLGAIEPSADTVLEKLVAGLCRDWRAADGHFVTRNYSFGRNRLAYHRWAQSQTFRALVMYLLSRPEVAHGGRPGA